MRAICVSGGGSKGQFHVGALEHLLGGLGIHYDIVCGVSVGALVGAFICQYPHGQEWKASLELTNLFSRISNEHVWEHWFPLNRLHGLHRSGFLNSAPLKRTIDKHLSVDKLRSSGKELRVGVTSLTTGEYRVFTQNDDPIKDIIYASASFPGAFSPVNLYGQLWSDGGITTTTPIKAAIEAGADVIDVVLASPSFPLVRNDMTPSAAEVAMRALEIQSVSKMNCDIERALVYNQLVGAGIIKDKKHVTFNIIKPEGKLVDDALNFNQKEAKIVQLQGFNAARKVL